MTEAAREVLELALSLPPEERARVVRVLCDSLEDPEPTSAAAEAAWRDEIRRRLDDVAREGKSYGSWDESLAKAERRLEERRRAKKSG
ncbi:MAG: addiction module protein [Planctomycetes bacterium]|nr:addiction module protein [Planctomycetota bacterium]